MITVHLLKPNHAKRAPYADEALCGQPCNDGTPLGIHAFWPGEKLVGGGKWCRECKDAEPAFLNANPGWK